MQSFDDVSSVAGPVRVTDDVWILDDKPINAAGLELPIRTVVIRLSNGDLVLHSPMRYSTALRHELERLGTIKFLLAPNIAHWMFLPDWQRELPQARTFAARGLAAANKFARQASASTASLEISRRRNGAPTSKPFQ
jgi:hypothetical protein